MTASMVKLPFTGKLDYALGFVENYEYAIKGFEFSCKANVP